MRLELKCPFFVVFIKNIDRICSKSPSSTFPFRLILGIRVPGTQKLLGKHWQGSRARSSHSLATLARRRLVRVINKARNESLLLPPSVAVSGTEDCKDVASPLDTHKLWR